MFVLATAGHVDHGKSTLLRALTGMDPDRWTEEQVRGMTIDLGYVWTDLSPGRTVAFVDVPGHERFLGNMLAGVGPVPAVVFVVAADEGWMPQSTEHLSALHALGVRHGLLVVTRADLADPELAAWEAREHLVDTSLAGIEWVGVSAVTGAGLEELRGALVRLVDGLPAPDPDAPVRLWLDRAFTIRGAGTVVTGTLGAGTIRVGDEMDLGGSQRVRVRGLQSLGRGVGQASATARLAVNLRGAVHGEMRRGMALLTPGRWQMADVVDVWLDSTGPASGEPTAPLASVLALHIGSARVSARIRLLGGDGTRLVARLTLDAALPLHLGDRALLRDPNQKRGERIVASVTVLDTCPPPLRRRGAAAERGGLLAGLPAVPDGRGVLRMRGLTRRADLLAMGCIPPSEPVAGEWLLDQDHADRLRRDLVEAVVQHAGAHPLEPGLPVEAARRALRLPERCLVEVLVAPPLQVSDGRVCDSRISGDLPPAAKAAVAQLHELLASRPFHAPEAEMLAEMGLDRPTLAAAERAGALLRIGAGIVMLADADSHAARILAQLAQPFTTSMARQVLDTTRRVVIPLLEHLDRKGLTERVDENLRRVREA